jgi:hypothetical protein
LNVNFLLRCRESVRNTRAPAMVWVGFVASPQATSLFLELSLGTNKKHVCLYCKNMITVRNILEYMFRNGN